MDPAPQIVWPVPDQLRPPVRNLILNPRSQHLKICAMLKKSQKLQFCSLYLWSTLSMPKNITHLSVSVALIRDRFDFASHASIFTHSLEAKQLLAELSSRCYRHDLPIFTLTSLIRQVKDLLKDGISTEILGTAFFCYEERKETSFRF